ncbi:IclR family transcriptional regulator [Marinitenerispora sediminis]|uniref:IclR family transcriptional regulator n=1 Tax=Marinitenerispora sediminis TaxID=1931232 RepID=UPI001313FE30|nr:IclR family transcriptional regulator [Marinitenerispora sediminis]
MDTENSGAAGARTLLRGLAVLEAVGRGRRRLTDLVEEVGTSRSTTHRLASALVAAGFLRVDDDGYRLSSKLIELGAKAEAELDVPGVVHETVLAVAERTGEAVHVGVLDGADVVYIDKARSRRGIELASRVGGRVRAQNTALGKAVLATRADAEALEVYDPRSRATRRSSASAEEFGAAVRQARADGYALDREENELGISCVAAPIAAPGAPAAAAISVTVPTVHLSAERTAELADVVTRAGARLGRQLGGGSALSWL